MKVLAEEPCQQLLRPESNLRGELKVSLTYDKRSAQTASTVASANYLDDAEFQDELLRLVIRDEQALTKLAPIITMEDFSASNERRVIGHIALEFWGKYRKPVTNLLRAEVQEHIRRKGLNEDRAAGLLGLVAVLESRHLSLSAEAVIERLYESKQSRRIMDAFRQMTDLYGAGHLTPEKMSELVRKSKVERPERRTTAAMDLGEVLQADFPPRPMMLNPVVPVRGLVMIHGYRGLGKSHIALGMGLACAMPSQFLHWGARKQHRVTYVAGEMSGAENKSMVNRLLWDAAQHAVQFPPGSKNEPRHFVTSSLAMIIASELEYGVPDLATKEGRDWLENDPLVRCSDLLILDNLSSLHRKGDEREQKGWNEMNEWFMHLKSNSVGKSVILVHHDGKNKEQRGTSFREDILDTVIQLREPSDMKHGAGVHCEIHLRKMRGYSPGNPACEPFVAKLDRVPKFDGLFAWNVLPLRAVNQQKAFTLFDAGMNVKEVMEELGISRATAFRYRHDYRDRSED